MKKLLFLFIPIVSLSQSFDDLMRVDSKEQFVRAMVENGYERISDNNSQLVMLLTHLMMKERSVFNCICKLS